MSLVLVGHTMFSWFGQDFGAQGLSTSLSLKQSSDPGFGVNQEDRAALKIHFQRDRVLTV